MLNSGYISTIGFIILIFLNAISLSTFDDKKLCIVECPVIGHVRRSITNFDGHILSHTYGYKQRFCSICNICDDVSGAGACWTFLVENNQV